MFTVLDFEKHGRYHIRKRLCLPVVSTWVHPRLLLGSSPFVGGFTPVCWWVHPRLLVGSPPFVGGFTTVCWWVHPRLLVGSSPFVGGFTPVFWWVHPRLLVGSPPFVGGFTTVCWWVRVLRGVFCFRRLDFVSCVLHCLCLWNVQY
jgi:hypothetical protein